MHRRGSDRRRKGRNRADAHASKTDGKKAQAKPCGWVDRSKLLLLSAPSPCPPFLHSFSPFRAGEDKEGRRTVRYRASRGRCGAPFAAPSPLEGREGGNGKTKKQKKSERNSALIVESTSSKKKVEKKYQQQTTPPPPPPPPFLFKNSSSRQRAPPRSPPPPRRCSAPARR